MSESLSAGLLRTKFAAAIAAILTGYVAGLDILETFRTPRPFHWLFDPFFFITSKWGLLAVNLAFYAVLMWAGFVAFRAASGKERIIVVGWFLSLFTYPISYFFTAPAIAAMQYVTAAAMTVAFLAALDIVLRYSVNHAKVET